MYNRKFYNEIGGIYYKVVEGGYEEGFRYEGGLPECSLYEMLGATPLILDRDEDSICGIDSSPFYGNPCLGGRVQITKCTQTLLEESLVCNEEITNVDEN